MKTDPCPFLVKYSPEVLKKKRKVLDVFYRDKKYFIKIIIESGSQEIWIRISFLEKTDPHHFIQHKYSIIFDRKVLQPNIVLF